MEAVGEAAGSVDVDGEEEAELEVESVINGETRALVGLEVRVDFVT